MAREKDLSSITISFSTPFLLYKGSMQRKLLLIALGVALAGTARAQSTNSTNTPPANPPPGGPPPAGPHHLDFSKILTPDEKKELEADHAAALQADPALGDEEKDLVEKMQEARESGEPPDPDLFSQMMELRQKTECRHAQRGS